VVLDHFQRKALEQLKSHLKRNDNAKGLLVMPPAAGKTIVVLKLLAESISGCSKKRQPIRAVFVAPNALLAGQAYREMQGLCPMVSNDGRSTVGIRLDWSNDRETGEIERGSSNSGRFSFEIWNSRTDDKVRRPIIDKELWDSEELKNSHSVVFASKSALESLNKSFPNAKYFGDNKASIRFLFFDEAHHAPAAGWSKVLNSIISSGRRRVFSIGLTATAFRGRRENEETTKFLEKYPKLVERSFGDYWRRNSPVENVLAKPRFREVQIKQNGNPVVFEWKRGSGPINRFEMIAQEEERKLRNKKGKSPGGSRLPFNNHKVVRECIKKVDDWVAGNAVNGTNGQEPKTIVFCRNILHAEILFKKITDGLGDTEKRKVVLVHSKQKFSEKWNYIRRFRKDKKCKICICVEMLAQGWDVPEVERVVITRWTRSERLIWQMIGRGLRGTRVSGGTIGLEVVWFNVKFEPEKEEFKLYTPKDFLGAVDGDSFGLGHEVEELFLKGDKNVTTGEKVGNVRNKGSIKKGSANKKYALRKGKNRRKSRRPRRDYFNSIGDARKKAKFRSGDNKNKSYIYYILKKSKSDGSYNEVEAWKNGVKIR
jgi:superfamily II DNA or RNA helicase